MPISRHRSMRADIVEGATDGKYRKARPNTASTPGNDAATLGTRAHLHPPMNWGFITQEQSGKVLPDGTRG